MYTVTRDHGGFNTFNVAFTVIRDDGTHDITDLGQRYSVASAKSVCQSHHRKHCSGPATLRQCSVPESKSNG